MCLDFEDENPVLCHKTNPIPYIVSIIVTLVIIGCVLGEILYRLEFQTIDEQNRDVNDRLLEYLDLIHNGHDPILIGANFDKIHSEGLVKELVAVLNLNLHLNELQEAFQFLYQLELSLHGNHINAELCLKKTLGTNKLAAKFLDYAMYSFATKMNLKIAICLNYVKVRIGSQIISLLTGASTMVMKVSIYYLDFIKDILFIIFIKKLVPEVNDSFHFHLLAILIVIFCISEVSKLHLAVSAKRTLNISHKGYLVTLLTFPLMPAVLIYAIERLTYRKNARKDCIALDNLICKINKLIARMKRNENTLENFPQLIIIVIIIGLALSPTATVTGLKGTIDPKDWILYTTASLSLLTIVRASVTQLKASLDGYLSFTGQLLYGGFIFISITSRLSATFLYFSQNLGLLPILWHWKLGSISAESSFIYDKFYGREMEFQDAWRLTENVTYYTWKSYIFFALVFITLAFIQIIGIFTIRWRSGNKADLFGYALDSLLSPQTGDIANIGLFTFGNLLLTIPLWILKFNIAKYERVQGFCRALLVSNDCDCNFAVEPHTE